ncbi:MAG: D-alanyl-D-alanine carboxypeptidase/D-alanyl-D-alanine-endopeptidase [Ignavibacteriae bacterium]|nr:D-alanyl-D-alanine carboxypeptidase/D-alanyl-D-alanine-endopeptidase [Ignavibacteriota bacterium]
MFKILSVLLIIAVQLSAQYEAVNSKIDSLLQEKFFESTVASVSAYNLTKDEPVYKKNEKLLLRPASNMKVISSSTMLYFLGPDYKYYTGIYSDGIIRNGTLYGDIYFYGNGDPSFSSSDLDSLIVMLKEKNVTEITGNVYGDVSAYDSIFWGEGWMWDDDPSYYFPYFSPLILNESGVTVTLIKNENEELEVKTFPESNYFKVVNLVNIKEEGRSRINITRDWLNRNNDITVKGSVNKKFTKYSTTISLFNPSDFFMFYTIERLKANGIRINGNYSFKERPEEITEIGKIESNFGDLINVLNKESDNLYAEAALKAVAYELKEKPASSKKGTELIDSLVTLIGLNPSNYYFADGSGVSHYNLVSAELLNSLLNYMYKYHPKLFEILYNSFPIGGIDGTLRGRMKADSVNGNVHAKTGTLSGVSTLSGYLTATNGDLISFSILMQNFVESSNIARSYQDKICEILTEIK